MQLMHHVNTAWSCLKVYGLSSMATLDSTRVTCPDCLELLAQKTEEALDGDHEPCPFCDGEGFSGEKRTDTWNAVCYSCNGSGIKVT